MEQECRREQPGQNVAPVNDFVEVVQLACVMEAEQHKRRQAERVEVNSLLRTAAAQVNEQTDGEIKRPNKVLVENDVAGMALADDHVGVGAASTALKVVFGGFPGTDPHQHLRNIERPANRHRFDARQDISLADSAIVGRTARHNVGGHHARRAFHPGHAIVRQLIPGLLLQVDSGSNHRRQR